MGCCVSTDRREDDREEGLEQVTAGGTTDPAEAAKLRPSASASNGPSEAQQSADASGATGSAAPPATPAAVARSSSSSAAAGPSARASESLAVGSARVPASRSDGSSAQAAGAQAGRLRFSPPIAPGEGSFLALAPLAEADKGAEQEKRDAAGGPAETPAVGGAVERGRDRGAEVRASEKEGKAAPAAALPPRPVTPAKGKAKEEEEEKRKAAGKQEAAGKRERGKAATAAAAAAAAKAAKPAAAASPAEAKAASPPVPPAVPVAAVAAVAGTAAAAVTPVARPPAASRAPAVAAPAAARGGQEVEDMRGAAWQAVLGSSLVGAVREGGGDPPVAAIVAGKMRTQLSDQLRALLGAPQAEEEDGVAEWRSIFEKVADVKEVVGRYSEGVKRQVQGEWVLRRGDVSSARQMAVKAQQLLLLLKGKEQGEGPELVTTLAHVLMGPTAALADLSARHALSVLSAHKQQQQQPQQSQPDTVVEEEAEEGSEVAPGPAPGPGGQLPGQQHGQLLSSLVAEATGMGDVALALLRLCCLLQLLQQGLLRPNPTAAAAPGRLEGRGGAIPSSSSVGGGKKGPGFGPLPAAKLAELASGHSRALHANMQRQAWIRANQDGKQMAQDVLEFGPRTLHFFSSHFRLAKDAGDMLKAAEAASEGAQGRGKGAGPEAGRGQGGAGGGTGGGKGEGSQGKDDGGVALLERLLLLAELRAPSLSGGAGGGAGAGGAVDPAHVEAIRDFHKRAAAHADRICETAGEVDSNILHEGAELAVAAAALSARLHEEHLGGEGGVGEGGRAVSIPTWAADATVDGGARLVAHAALLLSSLAEQSGAGKASGVAGGFLRPGKAGASGVLQPVSTVPGLGVGRDKDAGHAQVQLSEGVAVSALAHVQAAWLLLEDLVEEAVRGGRGSTRPIGDQMRLCARSGILLSALAATVDASGAPQQTSASRARERLRKDSNSAPAAATAAAAMVGRAGAVVKGACQVVRQLCEQQGQAGEAAAAALAAAVGGRTGGASGGAASAASSPGGGEGGALVRSGSAGGGGYGTFGDKTATEALKISVEELLDKGRLYVKLLENEPPQEPVRTRPAGGGRRGVRIAADKERKPAGPKQWDAKMLTAALRMSAALAAHAHLLTEYSSKTGGGAAGAATAAAATAEKRPVTPPSLNLAKEAAAAAGPEGAAPAAASAAAGGGGGGGGGTAPAGTGTAATAGAASSSPTTPTTVSPPPPAPPPYHFPSGPALPAAQVETSQLAERAARHGHVAIQKWTEGALVEEGVRAEAQLLLAAVEAHVRELQGAEGAAGGGEEEGAPGDNGAAAEAGDAANRARAGPHKALTSSLAAGTALGSPGDVLLLFHAAERALSLAQQVGFLTLAASQQSGALAAATAANSRHLAPVGAAPLHPLLAPPAPVLPAVAAAQAIHAAALHLLLLTPGQLAASATSVFGSAGAQFPPPSNKAVLLVARQQPAVAELLGSAGLLASKLAGEEGEKAGAGGRGGNRGAGGIYSHALTPVDNMGFDDDDGSQASTPAQVALQAASEAALLLSRTAGHAQALQGLCRSPFCPVGPACLSSAVECACAADRLASLLSSSHAAALPVDSSLRSAASALHALLQRHAALLASSQPWLAPQALGGALACVQATAAVQNNLRAQLAAKGKLDGGMATAAGRIAEALHAHVRAVAAQLLRVEGAGAAATGAGGLAGAIARHVQALFGKALGKGVVDGDLEAAASSISQQASSHRQAVDRAGLMLGGGRRDGEDDASGGGSAHERRGFGKSGPVLEDAMSAVVAVGGISGDKWLSVSEAVNELVQTAQAHAQDLWERCAGRSALDGASLATATSLLLLAAQHSHALQLQAVACGFPDPGTVQAGRDLVDALSVHLRVLSERKAFGIFSDAAAVQEGTKLAAAALGFAQLLHFQRASAQPGAVASCVRFAAEVCSHVQLLAGKAASGAPVDDTMIEAVGRSVEGLEGVLVGLLGHCRRPWQKGRAVVVGAAAAAGAASAASSAASAASSAAPTAGGATGRVAARRAAAAAAAAAASAPSASITVVVALTVSQSSSSAFADAACCVHSLSLTALAAMHAVAMQFFAADRRSKARHSSSLPLSETAARLLALAGALRQAVGDRAEVGGPGGDEDSVARSEELEGLVRAHVDRMKAWQGGRGAGMAAAAGGAGGAITAVKLAAEGARVAAKAASLSARLLSHCLAAAAIPLELLGGASRVSEQALAHADLLKNVVRNNGQVDAGTAMSALRWALDLQALLQQLLLAVGQEGVTAHAETLAEGFAMCQAVCKSAADVAVTAATAAWAAPAGAANGKEGATAGGATHLQVAFELATAASAAISHVRVVDGQRAAAVKAAAAAAAAAATAPALPPPSPSSAPPPSAFAGGNPNRLPPPSALRKPGLPPRSSSTNAASPGGEKGGQPGGAAAGSGAAAAGAAAGAGGQKAPPAAGLALTEGAGVDALATAAAAEASHAHLVCSSTRLSVQVAHLLHAAQEAAAAAEANPTSSSASSSAPPTPRRKAVSVEPLTPEMTAVAAAGMGEAAAGLAGDLSALAAAAGRVPVGVLCQAVNLLAAAGAHAGRLAQEASTPVMGGARGGVAAILPGNVAVAAAVAAEAGAHMQALHALASQRVVNAEAVKEADTVLRLAAAHVDGLAARCVGADNPGGAAGAAASAGAIPVSPMASTPTALPSPGGGASPGKGALLDPNAAPAVAAVGLVAALASHCLKLQGSWAQQAAAAGSSANCKAMEAAATSAEMLARRADSHLITLQGGRASSAAAFGAGRGAAQQRGAARSTAGNLLDDDAGAVKATARMTAAAVSHVKQLLPAVPIASTPLLLQGAAVGCEAAAHAAKLASATAVVHAAGAATGEVSTALALLKEAEALRASIQWHWQQVEGQALEVREGTGSNAAGGDDEDDEEDEEEEEEELVDERRNGGRRASVSRRLDGGKQARKDAALLRAVVGSAVVAAMAAAHGLLAEARALAGERVDGPLLSQAVALSDAASSHMQVMAVLTAAEFSGDFAFGSSAAAKPLQGLTSAASALARKASAHVDVMRSKVAMAARADAPLCAAVLAVVGEAAGHAAAMHAQLVPVVVARKQGEGDRGDGGAAAAVGSSGLSAEGLALHRQAVGEKGAVDMVVFAGGVTELSGLLEGCRLLVQHCAGLM